MNATRRGERTDLACKACGGTTSGLYVWLPRKPDGRRGSQQHIGSECSACGARELPAPRDEAATCEHLEVQVIMRRGPRPKRAWETVATRCRKCLIPLS